MFRVSGLRNWVTRVVAPQPDLLESGTTDIHHSADLQPGDVVGEYIILQKLGEGGFGAVYEAAHPVIGKRAAVKVLHAQHSADEAVTSRFVAEARAVNQIRHRNIVDIFSFGDLADGRHYYVMELLEGITLDAYLQRVGRLPIAEALDILNPIARALSAAHEAGIAHRDLKPENVFLGIDGEQHVEPKILDFGLAKLLAPGALTVHKTRSGTPMGTPRYMSPEQCRGVPVDQRTDVYSFGCMAYRMLTGVAPFDGSTALDIMMAHVSRPPIPPSQRADLDAVFDEPLLKMLEKCQDDRPQSVAQAFESLVTAASRSNVTETSSHGFASPALRDAALERERTFPRVSEIPKPKALPSVSPPVQPTRRGWAWPVVAIAILGVLVVGFLRRTAAPSGEHRNTPATVTAAQAPVIAPATSVQPPPLETADKTVDVTVNAQPPHAEVYFKGELLGVAPGPLKLPRGDQEQTLLLKAAGHVPTSVTLTPSTNQIVRVQLPPRSAKAAKKGVSRDLENPY